MLSKIIFWPQREEWHFKNRVVSRILIQASSILDSIIAHFCESNAHCPTFSTASTHRDVSRRRGNSVACGAKRPFRELRVPTGIDGSAPGSWRAAIPLVLAKPL